MQKQSLCFASDPLVYIGPGSGPASATLSNSHSLFPSLVLLVLPLHETDRLTPISNESTFELKLPLHDLPVDDQELVFAIGSSAETKPLSPPVQESTEEGSQLAGSKLVVLVLKTALL